MTLLIKLGLAAIGGGSLVAGSYGVYELIRPKTIVDQLKWESFDFPDLKGDSDDSGLWQTLYESYSTDNNKFTNPVPTEAISSGKTLKDHCNEVFKRNLPDEDNLKKAKKWCVKNPSN